MSNQSELAQLAGVFAGSALSNRNLIINGAMQISQRGDSTGITVAGYYGPDRFRTELSGLGTWSVSQSSTAPDGFGNSFKINCTTADASPATADYLVLYQHFEGKEVQRLKKGTSAAEKSTLSFWIRSNKTGTYQVNMRDNDNVRTIGRTYTIDAANTWEHKVVTFDGDTTGAYTNDVNLSMTIEWWLGSGTAFNSGAVPTSWEANDNTDRNAGSNVNLADSTSNELYLTGVQLEIGDTSTPFEHRSYADQLQACQRYYQFLDSISASGSGANLMYHRYADGTNAYAVAYQYFTPMRTSPTISYESGIRVHLPTLIIENGSFSASQISNQGAWMLVVPVTTIDGDGTNSKKVYFDAEL
jgi:hypothetical protein